MGCPRKQAPNQMAPTAPTMQSKTAHKTAPTMQSNTSKPEVEAKPKSTSKDNGQVGKGKSNVVNSKPAATKSTTINNKNMNANLGEKNPTMKAPSIKNKDKSVGNSNANAHKTKMATDITVLPPGATIMERAIANSVNPVPSGIRQLGARYPPNILSEMKAAFQFDQNFTDNPVLLNYLVHISGVDHSKRIKNWRLEQLRGLHKGAKEAAEAKQQSKKSGVSTKKAAVPPLVEESVQESETEDDGTSLIKMPIQLSNCPGEDQHRKRQMIDSRTYVQNMQSTEDDEEIEDIVIDIDSVRLLEVVRPAPGRRGRVGFFISYKDEDGNGSKKLMSEEEINQLFNINDVFTRFIKSMNNFEIIPLQTEIEKSRVRGG